MDLGLKGKKVLVTGASRGLGYATARGLAQEGASIVLNSRNEDKLKQSTAVLAQETGGTLIPHAGDLLDKSFPASLISNAAEQLGGLRLNWQGCC